MSEDRCVRGGVRFPFRAGAAACGLMLMAAGCQQTRECWILAGVDAKLPALQAAAGPCDRSCEQTGPLEVRGGGERTLLAYCRHTDNPFVSGDEQSHTFVVLLDGPPTIGKVAVTPANGRLIETGPGVPSHRSPTGLRGEVFIAAAEQPGRVIADCRLQSEPSRADESVRVVKGRYSFMPPQDRADLDGLRYTRSAAE